MIIKITEKIVEDLFVIGINDEISEDDLIKTFSVYGEVAYSKIIKNNFSQKTKGIAFIKFKERKMHLAQWLIMEKYFAKVIL